MSDESVMCNKFLGLPSWPITSKNMPCSHLPGHLGSTTSATAPYRSQVLPVLKEMFVSVPKNWISSGFSDTKVLLLNCM